MLTDWKVLFAALQLFVLISMWWYLVGDVGGFRTRITKGSTVQTGILTVVWIAVTGFVLWMVSEVLSVA